MIVRTIARRLTRLFKQYPCVTVTGPRQSGKTTLCRNTFPHLKYINLELPDVREFAQTDPRGFLSKVETGAILDEVQRVPEILSYIQVLCDEKKQNGLFILTGSQNFSLSDAISQSLAGRTGLLRLLPLSFDERRSTGAGEAIEDILYQGFYPRIYDQKLEPNQAYADYFETYVERDIRQIGEIRSLREFQRFVRLCAGRVGQLTNLYTLGADAGVSHSTAQNWLSLLETSFIAFRLPPFHTKIRKRLVKTPKLYFYDVGFASYLIGVKRPEHLITHPLRGVLFENMVVMEALKYSFNTGQRENLLFFRDSRGLECDLLIEIANELVAIAIKSGATVATDYFKLLNLVEDAIPEISRKILVYGGSSRQTRSGVEVLPYGDLRDVLEKIEVEEEIASYSHNQAGSQNQTDIEVLDLAFHAHIRPTLVHLEPFIEQQIKPLFRKYRVDSKLVTHLDKVSFGNSLRSIQWDSVKEKHLVLPGFELSDARSLLFSCQFELLQFVHNNELNLTVSLEWSFDGVALNVSIVVDGNPRPDLLDLRFPYPQLGTQSAKIDLICATVLKLIKSTIHSNREDSTSQM